MCKVASCASDTSVIAQANMDMLVVQGESLLCNYATNTQQIQRARDPRKADSKERSVVAFTSAVIYILRGPGMSMLVCSHLSSFARRWN